MKAVKLSKVVRASVPIVERRPPFGAPGLTQSKCWKSAGYLRSPKAESPCLKPCAAAGSKEPTPTSRASEGTANGRANLALAMGIVEFRGGLAPQIGEPLGRGLIIPPHAQEGTAAGWQLLGTPIHVPNRHALERRVV